MFFSCAGRPAAALVGEETEMEDSNLSRRRFLQLGAVGAGLVVVPKAALACTPTCSATEANIEGPYYRDGAPARANLVDGADIRGVPLVLAGRVLSLDCRSALSDAELDLWQADGDGHYDNDGTLSVPQSRFRLRGKLRTDKTGAFTVRTIVPGRYLNGRQYRPAHIHAKVRAQGHRALTTQLYFPDDPFNKVDPFIRPSLVMDMTRAGDGQEGHFNFVLTPA
jgi:protocatechuate 3,4-dioxygenase beta subunit